MSSHIRCSATTTRNTRCRNLATVDGLCTFHSNRRANSTETEALVDDLSIIMARFGIQDTRGRRRHNPLEVPHGFRPTSSSPRIVTKRLSKALDSQNRSPRSGENECVICMDTPSDRINVKCCKKPFCKKCIKKALEHKPECPACRKPKAGFNY